VTTCHFVTRLKLTLHGEEDIDHLHHDRGQIVAAAHLFDLVFEAAIEAELYTLAVIGVLASVVGAYYYVRIVKLMYFDEPAESFDAPLGGGLKLMILGSSVAMLVIPVVLNPVVMLPFYWLQRANKKHKHSMVIYCELSLT